MAQDDRLEGKPLKIAEKILRDVTEIPEQNGVGYFLDAGTLPGSVRENRVASRKCLLSVGDRLKCPLPRPIQSGFGAPSDFRPSPFHLPPCAPCRSGIERRGLGQGISRGDPAAKLSRNP